MPQPEARSFARLLALLAFVWVASASGLLSSNDGSHLALARALALRGETTIEPDRALTLGVDLSLHNDRVYSDRPPGTAFTALLAVWLGDRLDPAALARAQEQVRAGDDVHPLPACPPYISTYAKRFPAAPPLAKRIATSVLIGLHAALMGLLALVLLERMLVALGLAREARRFAIAGLGLATLLGPYSTALYAHVPSATMVSGFLLGVLALRRHADASTRAQAIALATGLAGAWAVACDYLLALAIVPTTLLALPWRRWPLVLLGTLPIALATLAYHDAAFGSPFAIGYDFHATFEFARSRNETFDGDMLEGLWILLGSGRGAGMLAQSPLALVGLVVLVVVALRDPQRRELGLLALGFVPWLLALGRHETPWGGGTDDHRYLIPLLPLAGLGLALAWARAGLLAKGLLLLLALGSAWRVWSHFTSWREVGLLESPLLGLLAALLVLLAAELVARRAR